MNRELLDRFYVELTNPDELGLTDPHVKEMYDLAVKGLQSVAPEAAPKLTEIVHVAVSRALDEAGIKNEVLRGMCIEVALETLPQPSGGE